MCSSKSWYNELSSSRAESSSLHLLKRHFATVIAISPLVAIERVQWCNLHPRNVVAIRYLERWKWMQINSGWGLIFSKVVNWQATPAFAGVKTAVASCWTEACETSSLRIALIRWPPTKLWSWSDRASWCKTIWGHFQIYASLSSFTTVIKVCYLPLKIVDPKICSCHGDYPLTLTIGTHTDILQLYCFAELHRRNLVTFSMIIISQLYRPIAATPTSGFHLSNQTVTMHKLGPTLPELAMLIRCCCCVLDLEHVQNYKFLYNL